MKKINKKDSRINAKQLTWKEYVIILFIFLCLTGGQAMILNEYIAIKYVPITFIMANIGYWALISLVFIGIASLINKKIYDKPMKELSIATKKVAEGDFTVYISPLRKDGKKDYVEVMFEDFNKMVSQLATIETLKTDFIANVSHEIKTPLSIIQNYASALKNKNLTTERKEEYSDTIIDAVQKLTMLVTNILRLNKLENQKIIETNNSFDLCRQLSECIINFEIFLENKKIDFNIDMDDQVMIYSNKDMLAIVWNNLLSNAIKFSDIGGTISLKQTIEKNEIIVSITDSGCGMDNKVIEHIFDKFYQADTSHSTEGNGLGLALVLKVLEHLNGKITVKSELNKGSTFTIILPLNNK